MRREMGAVLVGTVALLVPGARAQDRPDKPAPTERPGPAQGRRDEAFRMVDAYVIRHLQDALRLSDEQYDNVAPLVTHLQTERRRYFLERSRLLREMRRMLHAGGASEQQVLDKLTDLKRLEQEGPARIKSRGDALDAALTPLQQAKFRALELEVEQRVQELMNRLRTRPGRRSPR